jgi:hypothetical protein
MTTLSSSVPAPFTRRSLSEIVDREAKRRSRKRLVGWLTVGVLALQSAAANVVLRPKPLARAVLNPDYGAR